MIRFNGLRTGFPEPAQYVLNRNRDLCEQVGYISYKLGPLSDSGHMRRNEFDALAADYRRMHVRVFMPGTSLQIDSSFR